MSTTHDGEWKGDKFQDLQEALSDGCPRGGAGWGRGSRRCSWNGLQVLNHKDFYDRLGTVNFILKTS